MSFYRYLIVGGGMTAAAAVKGIREVDPQAKIGMISAEEDPPYDRPPLTKGLWKGKPIEKIWRKVGDQDLDLYLGRRVKEIDPRGRRVLDDQGAEFRYEKLLLATGGTPRRLPFGEEAILYFRTLADYNRLRELTVEKRRFAVIGGGFIGSEIAAALRMNDQQVVMVFPENGIGARLFPADLAKYLNDYYRAKGVEVLDGVLIQGLEQGDGMIRLQTKSGKEITADYVVAGIGLRPNVELAEAAGIKVEDGILVDEHLRTNLPDIYAAGDVAYFYNPQLDRRMRVEHEDNANTMGMIAGYNMAGRQSAYNHLPFFYSDMFDLGYEAVGELDSNLEVEADWEEPYQKGVVYYRRDGKLRGVLLWNVWGKVDAARGLIGKRGRLEEWKEKEKQAK